MAKGDNLTDKQRAFVSFYLGEARMNATKAAAMAGYRVPRQSGSECLTNPVIAAEIKAAQDELRAEGIAAKANRISDYAELRQRLWSVIEDRAKEYGDKGAPDDVMGRFVLGSDGRVIGGASGLVVKKLNVVGGGRSAKVIEEHQLDTGLITQLLNVDKQAAQELGEWSEKRQITGPDEGPIEIKNAESATERLLAWLAQDEATEGAGETPRPPQD